MFPQSIPTSISKNPIFCLNKFPVSSSQHSKTQLPQFLPFNIFQTSHRSLRLLMHRSTAILLSNVEVRKPWSVGKLISLSRTSKRQRRAISGIEKEGMITRENKIPRDVKMASTFRQWHGQQAVF